jgi:hypothetical protein
VQSCSSVLLLAPEASRAPPDYLYFRFHRHSLLPSERVLPSSTAPVCFSFRRALRVIPVGSHRGHRTANQITREIRSFGDPPHNSLMRLHTSTTGASSDTDELSSIAGLFPNWESGPSSLNELPISDLPSASPITSQRYKFSGRYPRVTLSRGFSIGSIGKSIRRISRSLAALTVASPSTLTPQPGNRQCVRVNHECS